MSEQSTEEQQTLPVKATLEVRGGAFPVRLEDLQSITDDDTTLYGVRLPVDVDPVGEPITLRVSNIPENVGVVYLGRATEPSQVDTEVPETTDEGQDTP